MLPLPPPQKPEPPIKLGPPKSTKFTRTSHKKPRRESSSGFWKQMTGEEITRCSTEHKNRRGQESPSPRDVTAASRSRTLRRRSSVKTPHSRSLTHSLTHSRLCAGVVGTAAPLRREEEGGGEGVSQGFDRTAGSQPMRCSL